MRTPEIFASLVRLASMLPPGDKTRRVILAKLAAQNSCSRGATSFAWVSPDGTLHRVPEEFTHAEWAFAHFDDPKHRALHEEVREARRTGVILSLERYDELEELEDECLERLINDGWIRVSNAYDISTSSKARSKAWETALQLTVDCLKRSGMDPFRTTINLDFGTSFREMTVDEAVHKYTPQLEHELYAKKASAAPEEDTEAKPSSRRRGPPPRFDEYMKARWDGGKKKVSNPNPKTRDRFKQVTVSTAMRDKIFMKSIMKDYHDWLGKQPKKNPSSAKPAATSKKFDLKMRKPQDWDKAFEWRGGIPIDASSLGYEETDLGSAIGLPFLKPKKGARVWFAKGDYEGGVVIEAYGLDHVDEISREFAENKKGEKFVHNACLIVNKNAPKGTGTRILAAQVAECKNLGLSYIECEAYQNPPKWNGAKTWAKLGYDGKIPIDKPGVPDLSDKTTGPLPDEIVAQFKKNKFKKPYMISHLMQVEGGPEWWDEHAVTFKAKFDLNDDSYSMRVLAAYLEKKAAQDKMTPEEWMSKIAKAAPITDQKTAAKKPAEEKHEELKLDEDEEAIAREVFAEMRKEQD